MAYSVRFHPRAVRSLDDIERYIVQRSPSGAKSVLAEVKRSITLLSDFPEIGRPLETNELRFQITRRYRYRIVYRLAGQEVQILQIYHPRQLPEES